jgi:hypothetical protein
MAINTPRNLARTAAATSSVTLYTVPASTTAVLTSIWVTNTTSSTQTFTIAVNGVNFLAASPLAGNSSVAIDVKQVVAATQTITGFASSTSVFFHLSGMEIV